MEGLVSFLSSATAGSVFGLYLGHELFKVTSSDPKGLIQTRIILTVESMESFYWVQGCLMGVGFCGDKRPQGNLYVSHLFLRNPDLNVRLVWNKKTSTGDTAKSAP